MSQRRWSVIALFIMGSPAIHSQEAREPLPGWNVSFVIPAGWHVLRRSGRAAALSDSLDAAALFVAAAFLATPSAAAAALQAMFADLHYAATPIRALIDTTITGRRAQVGHYQGAGRAGPVMAHAIVVFTEHGSGVTVLGLSTEERSAAVAATVVRVAASLEAAPPTSHTAWVKSLAGRWQYVPPPAAAQDSTAAGSVSIDESLEFDGRERFTWRSRKIVSVRLPGAASLVTEGDNDTGTYTVIGNTLVLRGDVTTRALEIELTGDRLSVGGRMFQRTPP